MSDVSCALHSQPAGRPRQRFMSPAESVRTCLQKYFCFNGRAGRSEYWWFSLASDLSFVVLFNILLYTSDIPLAVFLTLLHLGVWVVPNVAVTTRRLHDTGNSGWWQIAWLTCILGGWAFPWLNFMAGQILLNAIPVLAHLILVIVLCMPSEPYANRYGGIPCLKPGHRYQGKSVTMSHTISDRVAGKGSGWRTS